MFIQNMPLTIKVALCASNEALRQLELLEQPELFLESHQILEGQHGDDSFTVLTTYLTSQQECQIEAITQIIRKWEVGPRVSGTVKVNIRGGKKLSDQSRIAAEEIPFRLDWVISTGLLNGKVFQHPKVVLLE